MQQSRTYHPGDLLQGAPRSRTYFQPDAWLAFQKEMKGKYYGSEALTDAWLWFARGWELAVKPKTVTPENMLLAERIGALAYTGGAARDSCPYEDTVTETGRKSWNNAYRAAWLRGWEKERACKQAIISGE